MTLVQDILDLASKGPAGLDDAERIALLQASEKLTLALENPMEKFLRHFFVRLLNHSVYIHKPNVTRHFTIQS
jgi:hypothetical protein